MEVDAEDVFDSMMKLPAVAQSVTDSLQKQEQEMEALTKKLENIQVRMIFIFFTENNNGFY